MISTITATAYRFAMDIKYWTSQVHHSFKSNHSFSSGNEDLFLVNYFHSRKGKYVDIGAGHPKHGSNTYLLYKMGWSGVTVDPIKGMYLLHKLIRPSDKQILGVVSNQREKVTFYEYNPTEYSTVSPDHNSKMLKDGFRPRRTYLVDAMQLCKVFELLPNKPVELLCIDVEGHDLQILSQLNQLKHFPEVICAEIINNSQEIETLLLGFGYLNIRKLGNNAIFVKKDSQKVIES